MHTVHSSPAGRTYPSAFGSHQHRRMTSLICYIYQRPPCPVNFTPASNLHAKMASIPYPYYIYQSTVPGKGLFHCTRMPYGLTGAPATFQRLLDHLIDPAMEPHVFAYLDDIVVVTKTFDEHLERLSRVLSRIRGARLTINPDKSKFCRSHVKYLGFLVQHDGLKIDHDKTAPILEYSPPRNIRQLRVSLAWLHGIGDLFRIAPHN